MNTAWDSSDLLAGIHSGVRDLSHTFDVSRTGNFLNALSVCPSWRCDISCGHGFVLPTE